MKVTDIEKKIETIVDTNYNEIIQLIIDAVRTYPKFGLDDTIDFFIEINQLVKSKEINQENLSKYLDSIREHTNETDVWVTDSLSSLIEAFELMRIYNIQFKDVLNKIDSL